MVFQGQRTKTENSLMPTEGSLKGLSKETHFKGTWTLRVSNENYKIMHNEAFLVCNKAGTSLMVVG